MDGWMGCIQTLSRGFTSLVTERSPEGKAEGISEKISRTLFSVLVGLLD